MSHGSCQETKITRDGEKERERDLRVSVRAALLIPLQKTKFLSQETSMKTLLHKLTNQKKYYKPHIFYLHHLCGDFLFAESVYDDVGRDPSHTKHAALGTPRHQLNGERVLIHNLCAGFLLLTPCLLKYLRCLQFVQHLEHY